MIHLRSSYRTPESTNNSPLIRLVRAIDVSEFRVLSVSIPKSWTQITQTNNSIVIQDSVGDPYNVVIDVGNYDSATFVAALQTKIRALSAEFVALTVVLSTLTNKLTFTNATAFAFDWSGSAGRIPCSCLAAILGFDSIDDIAQVAVDQTTHFDIDPPGQVNLVVQPSLSLCSMALGSFGRIGITAGLETADLIARIPCGSTNYGEFVTWEPTDLIFSSGTKRIKDIDLCLRDDERNIVDLNGVGWEVVIRAR